jgi:segregation and condensation protein B
MRRIQSAIRRHIVDRNAELKAILEALIFASPEPLTPTAIDKLVDSEPKEDVQAALEALKRDYERPGGLQLVEVAGGLQIVTRPELHEWVRRMFHERSTQKLTVQALETLAVIAYKQPATGPEIMDIRGVQGVGVLKTLLDRKLIAVAGRKNVIGKPMLYKTTKEFLIQFGLKDLSELPSLKEFEEIRRMAFSDGEAPAQEAALVEDSAEDSAENAAEPAAEAPAAAPNAEPPNEEN